MIVRIYRWPTNPRRVLIAGSTLYDVAAQTLTNARNHPDCDVPDESTPKTELAPPFRDVKIVTWRSSSVRSSSIVEMLWTRDGVELVGAECRHDGWGRVVVMLAACPRGMRDDPGAVKR